MFKKCRKGLHGMSKSTEITNNCNDSEGIVVHLDDWKDKHLPPSFCFTPENFRNILVTPLGCDFYSENLFYIRYSAFR